MSSIFQRVSSRFISRETKEDEPEEVHESAEEAEVETPKNKSKRKKHKHHRHGSTSKHVKIDTEAEKNDDTPAVEPEISKQDFHEDVGVDAAVYQLVSASLGQDSKKRAAGSSSGPRNADDTEINDWTGQPWDKYINTEGMTEHTGQGNQEYAYYTSAPAGPASKSRKTKKNAQSSNVDPALAHLDEATTTTTQGYDIEDAVRHAKFIRAEMDDGSTKATEDKQYEEEARSSREKSATEVSTGSGYANGNSRSRAAADRRISWKGDGSEIGGTFTTREGETLEWFMENYRKDQGWSREELRRRVWATERQKDSFWDDVAGVLPHRTRASVYKHVRRIYHVFVSRGKWTKEEDKLLGELVNRKGSQWKLIGLDMARMPEDCRDRWRNYVKCGENRKSNKWDVEEENQLKRIVTKIIQDDPNGEVNWTLVSEGMGGTRSRIQCRYKWNKLSKKSGNEIENENDSMTVSKELSHDNVLQLLEILRSHSESQGQDVDWDGIARLMPGPEHYSGNNLRMSFDKLKRKITGYRTKSFNQLVLDILENELRDENGGEKEVGNEVNEREEFTTA